MEQLTLRHKIEIVRLVGDNARSIREAAEEFNVRHPNGPNVSSTTVYNINKVFNDTGSVSKRIIRGRNHEHFVGRHNDQILEYFRNIPNSSLRSASLDLNIPRETIRRCLVKNHLKPYKPKFLNTLEPGDEDRRLEFCLWAQGEYLNNSNFIKEILYTDEATFTTNGTVSSQNSRYWSVENPNWVINCKRQYSLKVNVWCGILHNKIIGPFFFEGNSNRFQFLDFLRNEFSEALDSLPIRDRVNLKFQLDGCPVHNAVIVRQWLNNHFRNQWIGPNSPLIEFPPRSPDLTPMDFFLWGTIKEKVYKSRPQTIEDLRARIRNACLEITPTQLRRVSNNIKKRYEKCITLNGGLVEASKI